MIRRFRDGDIVTSGRQFLSGSEATAQGVFHRLRMFRGEGFRDVSDGTPWFQSILGKTPQGVAETSIKQRIVSAPGVALITRFRYDPDLAQRRISVSASIIDSRTREQVAISVNEDLI